jgi:hypothetical protein
MMDREPCPTETDPGAAANSAAETDEAEAGPGDTTAPR